MLLSQDSDDPPRTGNLYIIDAQFKLRHDKDQEVARPHAGDELLLAQHVKIIKSSSSTA